MMFLKGLGDCVGNPPVCMPDTEVGPAVDCTAPSADPASPCFNQTFANLKSMDVQAQARDNAHPSSTTASASTASAAPWYTTGKGIGFALLLAAGAFAGYRHYKKRIA